MNDLAAFCFAVVIACVAFMLYDCCRSPRPSTPPPPDVALVHDLAEQGGWLR